ncbi:MAG: hypothetical protein RI897_3762 [Verrucomicrobiota bacterium]
MDAGEEERGWGVLGLGEFESLAGCVDGGEEDGAAGVGREVRDCESVLEGVEEEAELILGQGFPAGLLAEGVGGRDGERGERIGVREE